MRKIKLNKLIQINPLLQYFVLLPFFLAWLIVLQGAIKNYFEEVKAMKYFMSKEIKEKVKIFDEEIPTEDDKIKDLLVKQMYEIKRLENELKFAREMAIRKHRENISLREEIEILKVHLKVGEENVV